MSDKLVIIPTYKEKENIGSMIDAIMALEGNFHLLVIDDGSPDGTADIVREKQDDNGPRIFLIEREKKLGLGTAYIYGFKWGLERDYQYLFEMDADFSHPPQDLLRLFKTCSDEGVDVAIGSRYVEGGGVVNWPKNRLFLSKGASLYTKIVTGMHIQDPTAGFVCYRREVLETLDLDKVKFVGYAFQIGMKYLAYKAGFILKEIPIQFVERQFGVSKMHMGIIREAIIGVLQLRLSSVFRIRRVKQKRITSNK
ncbi:MAG: polyprenol monophosphomannose synthase [Saprospiraceae bacterium]|uniref:Polyprenol monophosphomannose synthase n=1 Tax=Candidatus Opimibacter skivensis TaxID=2982028 RepID=A0A9D7SRP2_9BACT|nr:polyprenol monophosphomannose synthase [Candidatus Opimibacter skivensis]